MANRLTEREIYTAMINNTIDPDVMAEFAEKKLAQLDKRNATAAKRAAAKRAETDALLETVYGVLSDEPMDRTEIANVLAEQGVETTLGKITSRLSALVKEGRANKAKAKVEGEDGKSHDITVYTVA
jgi:23S rRNA G2445 N2-methylase RlmL